MSNAAQTSVAPLTPDIASDSMVSPLPDGGLALRPPARSAKAGYFYCECGNVRPQRRKFRPESGGMDSRDN